MNENALAIDLAEIMIIRHDRNGAQVSFADIVKLPAEYVEKDCSGSAAMRYLEDVMTEYARERFDAERIVVWNDLWGEYEAGNRQGYIDEIADAKLKAAGIAFEILDYVPVSIAA